MKTTIEPFRTKMVEPIRFTTKSERQQILQKAGFNLFQVKAEDVIIDLLTDSGTSAMSSQQWGAMMRGDESYAGCASFYRFREQVWQTFGFPEVIPVHQGRAAERLLFSCLVKPGDIVPSNTHFDTTRANLAALGGQPVDLPSSESQDPESTHPFKGNVDLGALEALLSGDSARRVPFAMVTITNNASGGQPVSLANLKEYSRILHEHGIPLFIDAARFAENAYLIKQRELAYRKRSICSLVKEMFACADGCLMSAKKDGLVNMGGFIALWDNGLATRVREASILTEGFPTYGGLCGRDLEAIAVGLDEVLSEDYLKYREASARYLADGLSREGIPIVQPAGLHAIYIDAGKLLPHISPWQLPGQALACQLYLEGGIRTCEIGTLMFGSPHGEPERQACARHELVRLALPRRVYSQSHYDYVIEAAANVLSRRQAISGMRIIWQASALRHFTARLEPLIGSSVPAPSELVPTAGSLAGQGIPQSVGER
jgi:tryptophanase